MLTKLEHFFDFAGQGTAWRLELCAGVTTFAAMAYIIFLQPTIMSGQMFGLHTGMDFNALVTTTCLVSAFGCLLMGLVANFPVGLAPGMGENFLFVLSLLPVCALATGGKMGDPAVWQLGLGVVLLSGLIFAVISFLNVRQIIMRAISHSMKHAIAAGIGLFIALLGLQNSQIIKLDKDHFAMNANLHNPAIWVFFIGLITIAVLHHYKVRGGILLGILASALAAWLFGEIKLGTPIGMPANPLPLIGHADLDGVFRHLQILLPLVIIFTFMDVFDTLGTVIGVGTQSGLMKNDELPNSSQIFACDATATVAGAMAGHSTVTAYVESATGVEAGGRTGVTAIVVGLCFLLAMFFAPFVGIIAKYMPITAPALIVVGAMMLKNAVEVDWRDYSEAIPAFLIIIGIPFTSSIADGMILGFIVYPVIKLICGQGRSVGWLMYIMAVLLLCYLMFLR